MSKWAEVTKGRRCEVCDHDHWCSRNGEAIKCRRESTHPTRGPGIETTDNLGTYWLWPSSRNGDGPGALPEPAIMPTGDEKRAVPDVLHQIYTDLLAQLPLLSTPLLRRGLTPQQIATLRDEAMYRTLERSGRAKAVAKLIEAGLEKHFPHVPGFVIREPKEGSRYWTLNARGTGLLIPARDVESRIVAIKIHCDDATGGGKYRWLTSRSKRTPSAPSPGAPVHISPFGKDTGTVRVTEGGIKSDVAALVTGIRTISLPGVQSWRRAAKVLKSLGATRVLIALDADCRRNRNVADALENLCVDLSEKGFDVAVERWDESCGKGIDDVLLAGGTIGTIEESELQQWIADIVASAGKATARQIDGRYQDEVLADEWITIAETIRGLSADETLFQRQGQLVKLVRLPEDELERGVKRIRQTPKLIPAKAQYIREQITRQCFLFKTTEDGEKQVPPPEWLYRGITERGHWDHFRPISGFTEVPILRADGTVLDTPGYDERSHIVYLCDGEPPAIPNEPTHAQAVAARDDLMDIFTDFPFASDSDRAAALAGILTMFCRDCIPGCVPLFLVESAEAGTGKGLYCDVAGIISTGREMPKMSNPTDVEETRKAITSCLMAGDSEIVLDNIRGTLGNAAIDKALTDTVWKDRILGGNETGEWPMRIVFYATANNPTIGSDTYRRIVRIRMEADCENPSERGQFKYPRLKQHVRENRLRYVIDALTILRAYIVAGRPKAKLSTFGSFEEWSDLVRQAVVCTEMDDPVVSAKSLASDEDAKRAAFRTIVELWETVDPNREGLTTSRLVEQVKDTAQHEPFRDALVELGCVKDGRLDARTTSYRFREFKGRVVGEFRFGQAGQTRGSQKWVAKPNTPKSREARRDDRDDRDQSRQRGFLPQHFSAKEEGKKPTPGETIPAIPVIPAREPEPHDCTQCQVCKFPPSKDCDREHCPHSQDHS